MTTGTTETRWICPACGSEEIERLAWVRINGERVVRWDEGVVYWCPRCEGHYKEICKVDVGTSQCLIHNLPIDKCWQQHCALQDQEGLTPDQIGELRCMILVAKAEDRR